MGYSKPVGDLIKMRTSTRTFDGRAVEPQALQELENFISEINSRNKIAGHFQIVNLGDSAVGQSRKLGTYGVISGAQYYVAGLIDQAQRDALTFGYLFEEIILKATDLGIDTCWLGGTFNRSDLASKLSLPDQMTIPVISPLGYAAEKRRMLENAMRKMVKADQRKPREQLFYAADCKNALSEADAGAYAEPLEMIRLGPSASNKQPWRVSRDKGNYHFFLCRNKGYGVPGFDLQMNDIGIAMCHFELTAREAGLEGSWKTSPPYKKPDDCGYVISWIADDA